jgi:hypothetical protein
VDRALTTNNQLVSIDNLFRWVTTPLPGGGSSMRSDVNATFVMDESTPSFESDLMSIEVWCS